MKSAKPNSRRFPIPCVSHLCLPLLELLGHLLGQLHILEHALQLARPLVTTLGLEKEKERHQREREEENHKPTGTEIEV